VNEDSRNFSHLVGFDDAPFARRHRGDVLVVGTVFAGARLDGVVSTRVRRDGANATDRLIAVLAVSRFREQLHAILLQGIAFAGFNVVDVERLHYSLALPVLVVARQPPDMAAVRRALLERVPGGRRKWALIERMGPMEPAAGVYVQRSGITLDQAAALVRQSAVNGRLPEPLRTAHLVAGGVGAGESRHRP
jgi:endonuclease V-like protein UPF0215 family